MNSQAVTDFEALDRQAFREKQFALCLTHDVDRPYKTIQAPYRAFRERDLSHCNHFFTDERPYWQFDTIQAIEDEFGVRSSFYFLNERRLVRDLPKRAWLTPRNWIRYTGHYAIDDPAIVRVIQELHNGGWEIGLHGSFSSYDDRARLEYEKAALESVLGTSITGGRQHFLNRSIPATWRHHRAIGLSYDSSLGSSSSAGFLHGYDVRRPFDDDFLVFPLTAMEVALHTADNSLEVAKTRVDQLIEEAARNQAVMTVLWHIRLFNTDEFPGYAELYRYLIKRAIDANAWIGPVRDLAHAFNGEENRIPEDTPRSAGTQ